MPERIELTPSQRRRCNRLIKRLCANYDDGNCLLLDDGEPCVCPQTISYSLLCRYFRNAVLPAEQGAVCGHFQAAYLSLRRMRGGFCAKLQPAEILPIVQQTRCTAGRKTRAQRKAQKRTH